MQQRKFKRQREEEEEEERRHAMQLGRGGGERTYFTPNRHFSRNTPKGKRQLIQDCIKRTSKLQITDGIAVVLH